MKNLKRAAALTMIAGGIVAAGAGAASACEQGAPAPAAHAQASGQAVHSPGVGSGNLVQIPVDVPVNVVGNTVNVIGLLNPAFGNHGVNF
ncbi:chaplin [Streptomyces fuscigenes]|uniref:chaplin n=1 Tax=Streptomyces fuscigenes TaxID=1528880 RepID=UPI001F1810AA|nr:chaplin [Streptomyces fuscigenes]MCF3963198.1 chaplin [Streptomyces fuscigenes]